MADIRDTVDEMIKDKEEDIAEIDYMLEDGFNPRDASGGNFDDAYQIGYDHGYEYGYMAALKRIKSAMENGY